MFARLLKDKTSNLLLQLVRYVVSGSIAFSVDFGLLYLLTEYAHLDYRIAATIGFTAGMVVTYLLSIYWIFDQRRTDNRKVEFLIFAGIGLIGVALTLFLMWLFTDFLEIYYLISKLLSTIVVTLFNFIAKKYILFTSSNQQ